jgi:uncharacterized protein
MDRVVARQHGNPTEHVPHMPYFEEIAQRFMGRRGALETLGNAFYSPNLFIDSDGSVHIVDALKMTAEGMTSLDISVLDKPGIGTWDLRARAKMHRLGISNQPPFCEPCDLWDYCGGGFYPTRYDPSLAKPFARPSVYHPDLYKLISHIKNRLIQVSPPTPKKAAP